MGAGRREQTRAAALAPRPPGLSAPAARPGSYRGVSREAAAAALELLPGRSGLAPARPPLHAREGPGAAAHSALDAGARRARVPAGPAAATGALRRRRCRRLW